MLCKISLIPAPPPGHARPMADLARHGSVSALVRSAVAQQRLRNAVQRPPAATEMPGG
jgi:hypothetical protein